MGSFGECLLAHRYSCPGALLSQNMLVDSSIYSSSLNFIIYFSLEMSLQCNCFGLILHLNCVGHWKFDLACSTEKWKG